MRSVTGHGTKNSSASASAITDGKLNPTSHFIINVRSKKEWKEESDKGYNYENLTFSVFKCYNLVPGASTNPENNIFW